jgi:hypothetical protein
MVTPQVVDVKTMENKYAIESNNLSIHYGSYTAVKCKCKDPAAEDHRHHRAFRVRQVHASAIFESHE